MADLAPLPVTVIAGYLGAGKTSLVNHLLRHAGGRRILVMVNDFGELNIDADLLESADDDTITLSNGCICCTMGTELFYALSDALDRRPRPDCLVIEASGVAEPEKIAAAAHAEPEMRYCGVITMADAANIGPLLADRMIGQQLAAQLTAADLILLTKTDIADETASRRAIGAVAKAPVLLAPRGAVDVDLILDRPETDAPMPEVGGDHGSTYVSWSAKGGDVDETALKAFLAAPPDGLYRFKGRLTTKTGAIEAHLVGHVWEIARIPEIEATRAVAIGLATSFDVNAMAKAWRRICF